MGVRNGDLPWTEDEFDLAKRYFLAGDTPAEIAQRREFIGRRPDYAIRSKLHSAGFTARTRHEPKIAELADGTGRLFEGRPGRSGLRVNLEALRDQLLHDIKQSLPKRPKAVQKRMDGLLHVCSPADLHIGKLSWEPETGEDFDSKIASDYLRTATDKLMRHVDRYEVGQHLLVVGNDLLQVDNLISTTTAGTYQDTDSRYRKMFRLAVQLMRETVERLAETAPVRVLVVPGNHDQLASFHVGEVLGAIYHNHPTVSVSGQLLPRLYHRHGNTLLGFCHGNEEKHQDLPLIMAQENPKDWGVTTYREFLVGHLHKKREKAFTAGDSHNGVRVIVLPSLTGTDSWHSKRGYVGEPKASEARLYDRTDGLVATFTGRVK